MSSPWTRTAAEAVFDGVTCRVLEDKNNVGGWRWEIGQRGEPGHCLGNCKTEAGARSAVKRIIERRRADARLRKLEADRAAKKKTLVDPSEAMRADGAIPLCCEECGYEYTVRPVSRLGDGTGYYSSEKDFCRKCGAGGPRGVIHAP